MYIDSTTRPSPPPPLTRPLHPSKSMAQFYSNFESHAHTLRKLSEHVVRMWTLVRVWVFLAGLAEGVGVLLFLAGLSIHTELKEQEKILDDLENRTDYAVQNMDQVNRMVKGMLKSKEGRSQVKLYVMCLVCACVCLCVLVCGGVCARARACAAN